MRSSTTASTALVRRLVIGFALACLMVGTVSSAGGAASRPMDAGLSGEITVSGAASLTESFTALSKQFRQLHPRVRVRLNFASTSSLVSQIQSGAPVDVFASADMASQDTLAASGNIVALPRIFAQNTMQIAVKPGNPLAIRTLADLARARIVALCSASAPCGVYASSVLNRSRTVIPTSSMTRSVDAKATLAAVSFGDADAAIVYATDVKAAGRSVTGIRIPTPSNVRALYGISVVRGSANPKTARAFVNFVMSPKGQQTLRDFGFLAS